MKTIYTEKEIEAIRDLGRWAASIGSPKSSNPCPSMPELADAWQEGWNDFVPRETIAKNPSAYWETVRAQYDWVTRWHDPVPRETIRPPVYLASKRNALVGVLVAIALYAVLNIIFSQ